MVLYPGVSLVSINPEGSHNYSARDARALAQCRISLLLALEIASMGRAATNRDGAARNDPSDERRKPGGVDRTPDHRGISLGRCSGLNDPRPRWDLWRRRHTPTASHGHSGQTDCPGLTLAERHCRTVIGSIRRECLDHIIVSGEAHLRRILISYAAYYDSVRTHRSLHKDAPSFRPIQHVGIIRSNPILGGLHHHYVRV